MWKFWSRVVCWVRGCDRGEGWIEGKWNVTQPVSSSSGCGFVCITYTVSTTGFVVRTPCRCCGR